MLKTVYFDAHHRHKWQCFRIRLVDKIKDLKSSAPIGILFIVKPFFIGYIEKHMNFTRHTNSSFQSSQMKIFYKKQHQSLQLH